MAFRNKHEQNAGAANASRSSSKPAGKKSKPQKGTQEKNGFNRRTGERNRRYRCGSEYHLLPECPIKREPKALAAARNPPSNPGSPFSSIILEDSPPGNKSAEHYCTTSLKVDRPIFYAQNESVVILDAGATANLVCFRCLRRHNELLAS